MTDLTDKAVVLRPEDDVAIAKKELAKGLLLEDGDPGSRCAPTSGRATRWPGARCAAGSPCAATAR